MSHTRYQDYSKEAFIGGLSATMTAIATFGVDKMIYVYNTLHQTTSPTLKEVASRAWTTKFKGLGMSLLNNASYSIIMFPVKFEVARIMQKWNSDSAVNKQIAGFAGGATALLTTYPLSVIQVWRFEGKERSEIMAMSPKRFYRGIYSACLCDGVFFGVYFGIGPILSKYLSSLSVVPKEAADNVADTAAALLGGVACNPLYVISTCQKTSNKNMIEEAVSLYQQGGLPRFYRGLGTIGLFSVGLYGLTAGASIRYAEEIYEHRLAPGRE